jgi:DNA-binding beta-propeller fold protein YncE
MKTSASPGRTTHRLLAASRITGGVFCIVVFLLPASGAAKPPLQAAEEGTTGAELLVYEAGLSYPYALGLTPVGDILVADAKNHRLVLFDPGSGRMLDRLGKKGAAPGEFGAIEDMAVGLDGSIYVLESRPSRVQRLHPDGAPDTVVAGGWCSPNGLDVDEGARIYLAETCGSQIVQMDADGVIERIYTGGTDRRTRLEQPLDVVVGESGDLFVVDLHRRLVRIDAQSDQIVASWPVEVGGAAASSSVAADGSVIYITDPDDNVITRVDTDSGEVLEFGRQGPAFGELTTPLGIAVGSDGEVYVGDGMIGRIQAFELTPRDR